MMRTLMLAGLCAIGHTHPASAQEVKVTTFGKWEVGVGSNFIDAYTINDQGQRFGLYCADRCVGVVSPPYPCKQGDTGAALFNTQAGALFLKLACAVYKGDAVLTFEENPAGAFKNKTDVAFAFPGINATFVTMRFSLNGAAEAYAHMTREIEKRQ